MEVTRQRASVVYRAILCIPIVCTFLLSPVTVYALIYWAKLEASLPPVATQIREQLTTEELNKLDNNCKDEFLEVFGSSPTEERMMREAISAFCTCNSITTIVARAKAEQFFQHRLDEDSKILQEIKTEEVLLTDEIRQHTHLGLPFSTKLPSELVQRHSAMLQHLEQEKSEFYRQHYVAGVNQQCLPILAPWSGSYSLDVQDYPRIQRKLPASSPPALKRIPDLRRRVTHLTTP